MKSVGVFLLLGLVFLWAELPPTAGKAGTCPVVRYRCALPNPPDSCFSDYQCPGFKKCCESSCGRRCVTPEQHNRGKAGTCPVVRYRCALPNPPNSCSSDHQCPGFKKCCESSCGRRCVTPEQHNKDPLPAVRGPPQKWP
ncbi:antileukoproteinase-like [Carettochelys insculpta]|uniref:antileukoproteinase-like n=1 Tax=Carettochelys insculpta TaxID=44489 RepID=UPI003EBAD7BC